MTDPNLNPFPGQPGSQPPTTPPTTPPPYSAPQQYNAPPTYGAPQQPYAAPGTPPPYVAPQPSFPQHPGVEFGSPAHQAMQQPGGFAPYPQTTSPLAAWPTRAYGALFDFIIPLIVFNVIGSPFAPRITSNGDFVGGGAIYSLISLLSIAFWVYNSGYLQGTTGKSLGKRMAKTTLVSEETGRPIGFALAVVRHIAHVIDAVICGIGFLFPLWDAKKQTIADKIMKTVVITDQQA